MKFIIAKKIEMSQEFGEDGLVTPVTILEAGPVTVTQIKTEGTDGYTAVQVGFGTRKAKNVSKPVKGHLKNAGPFKILKEFRISKSGEQAEQFERGQVIAVDVFAPGEAVDVVGTSHGRGYAGVVKRHGFSGSLKTHGHKDQLRMSGSIGAGGPQHVFKGMRMSGRMGNARVTVKNLEVMAVDPAKNQIKVKGAVPGVRGSLVYITAARNSKKKK